MTIDEDVFLAAVAAARKSSGRFGAGVLGSDVEAEDALQIAIMHAWERRHQYRGTSPLAAWVSVIIRNQIFQTNRNIKNRREESWEFSLGNSKSDGPTGNLNFGHSKRREFCSEQPSPEAIAIEADLHRHQLKLVRRWVRGLPRCQKAVIVKILAGLPESPRERVRKFHAIRKLRKLAEAQARARLKGQKK